MTYHNTNAPAHHAWEAGDVVRLGDWSFADAVILGFNNEGRALLARPYLYASGVGSTGPTAMTGVELVDDMDLTRGHYKKLDSGRTVR